MTATPASEANASSQNSTAKTSGTIRVVGAGLLGTSIGLALTKAGVDVVIDTQSAASLALALEYGAGRKAQPGDTPSLIIVCVPPDLTAPIVARELAAHPGAFVTDVASVKAEILEQLRETGADLTRYVGGHPMAGRERGGAISGRADLFVGRPWVIAANAETAAAAVAALETLAVDLGATPIHVAPIEHDRAVALVSHVPQLVSSLLAARLQDADSSDLALAGQGLRDTTRIAASDPAMWTQILKANAEPVAEILEDLAADLNEVIAALADITSPGALQEVTRALEAGNAGVSRIPGKHGATAAKYATVVVMVDDRPGELARLLTEVGQLGVNLEDLKLEHSPEAQIGLAELYVNPADEAALIADLLNLGWRIAA
jgi:prephenate dehydrogenase